MAVGVLGSVLDAVASNLSGFGTLVGLLFGFRWLRRGARVGFYMQMAGYFLGFLAVLMFLGVVDGIDPSPIVELVVAVAELLGDLAGVFG